MRIQWAKIKVIKDKIVKMRRSKRNKSRFQPSIKVASSQFVSLFPIKENSEKVEWKLLITLTGGDKKLKSGFISSLVYCTILLQSCCFFFLAGNLI